MKKIETELKDCYILEPDKFGDSRGYFSPYFIDKNLESLGFKKVVQTNRSKSSKGVLRGLHFQKNPKCQAKVVEVIKGSAIDVVVDMRIDSPTYGKFIAVKLTEDNNKQLYVPRGFAHGFISLEDDTIFQYLIDNDYAPKMEAGILWNDKDLGINWEEIFKENGIDNPLLSPKDQIHPTLKDNKVLFKREQDKYLITGAKGQLGYDLIKTLINNGIKKENIYALDIDELDITDRKQVFDTIERINPDVIFHVAAWTNVDKAEQEKDKVEAINVMGTKNITDASIEVGAKLIYTSTDYVFDGTKDIPYTEEDTPNPKSVYGDTKFRGEEEVRRNPKHFITRISWVFGINGNNFMRTMLKLSDNHNTLNVVDDQIGSPTYTVDLSKLLVDISQTDNYGTYNVTNEGYTSWADYAEYIFKIANKEVKVNHVSTDDYLKLTSYSQAYRPRNSRLDKSKLESIGLSKLPTWMDAADRYYKELEDENRLILRLRRELK